MDEALRRHLRRGEAAGMRYRLALDLPRSSGRAGNYLANRAGSSREFHDHREYLPGDDLRHIDWSAYARSDRLTIKLFREEVSPHLDLVLDASRSMNLRGSRKGRVAAGITALLAQAACNAGYTFRPWTVGRRCRALGGLNEPCLLWQGLDFESELAFDEALQAGRPDWRARGVRILVSDLLWPGDPLRTLRLLGRGAARLAVVQVLARQDADPEAYGNVRLIDSESGEEREAHVDAATLRAYKQALSRHQDSWQAACRQCAAPMATIVAEDLGQRWRLDQLVAAQILEAA